MIYLTVFVVVTVATYWLLLLVRQQFSEYSYKFEYKGNNAISKYRFIVYYNDKTIHQDAYHETSLFGYPQMLVQALSHRRRSNE